MGERPVAGVRAVGKQIAVVVCGVTAMVMELCSIEMSKYGPFSLI